MSVLLFFIIGIIGIVAGFFAYRFIIKDIVTTESMVPGLLFILFMSIIVGIVGGVLGSLLWSLIAAPLSPSFWVRLLSGTIGSVVFLLIFSLVIKNKFS